MIKKKKKKPSIFVGNKLLKNQTAKKWDKTSIPREQTPISVWDEVL